MLAISPQDETIMKINEFSILQERKYFNQSRRKQICTVRKK